MSKNAPDNTYNGWKNWETWNANLWLNNDELTYNTCLDLVKIHKNNRLKTSQAIEELWLDITENGYVTDKITLHRIDFDEIAKTFLTI